MIRMLLVVDLFVYVVGRRAKLWQDLDWTFCDFYFFVFFSLSKIKIKSGSSGYRETF